MRTEGIPSVLTLTTRVSRTGTRMAAQRVFSYPAGCHPGQRDERKRQMHTNAAPVPDPSDDEDHAFDIGGTDQRPVFSPGRVIIPGYTR